MLVLLLVVLTGSKSFAQVSSQTTGNARPVTTVFSVTVASQDSMTDLVNTFLKNYHDRFSAATGNYSDQTVTLTYGGIGEEDILQVFLSLGYRASFVRDDKRYFVGPDGYTMVYDEIKH